MIWLALGGSLFALMASGAFLGVALGLTGLLILQVFGNGATSLAASAVWNMLTDFTLSSVIIFLYLGEIFFKSGLSGRSYSSIAPLFRRLPGGLLHTNVAVCALFGAVSGASTATAAAVGSAAYPELSRRGYDPRHVVASLAGAGTLGLLIPPSLSLIIFGATQEVSIAKLFLAGVTPGILVAFLFMLYGSALGIVRPQATPMFDESSDEHPLIALIGIWPLVLLAVSVLGPLYGGLATPTEAAAIGMFFVIVLGMTAGTLTFPKLQEAISQATVKFAALIFVVIGAVILKQAISIIGLPQKTIADAVGLGLGKVEILLLVIVFYIVLGCFFDGLSLMLMTAPFIYPVMVGYGYDPVWIGVLITLLIEIGMITPPVGPNLFILVSITENRVSLSDAAIATIPYWLLLLVAIALLSLMPQIAIWLPDLVYG